MSNDKIEAVGDVVCNIAYHIFEYCGEPEDYQIRSVRYNEVVFGSENCVRYNPLTGFTVDICNSTKPFIKKFNELIRR
jgi:hypothetical protein